MFSTPTIELPGICLCQSFGITQPCVTGKAWPDSKRLLHVVWLAGAHSVKVEWKEPEELNGVLQYYLIYASLIPISDGNILYNNSDKFLYYELKNLTAGTTYHIRIGVSSTNQLSYYNLIHVLTFFLYFPHHFESSCFLHSFNGQTHNHIVWARKKQQQAYSKPTPWREDKIRRILILFPNLLHCSGSDLP